MTIRACLVSSLLIPRESLSRKTIFHELWFRLHTSQPKIYELYCYKWVFFDAAELCLYRIESGEPWRAETILDLYIRFKVFVNGYKSVFRSWKYCTPWEPNAPPQSSSNSVLLKYAFPYITGHQFWYNAYRDWCPVFSCKSPCLQGFSYTF